MQHFKQMRKDRTNQVSHRKHLRRAANRRNREENVRAERLVQVHHAIVINDVVCVAVAWEEVHRLNNCTLAYKDSSLPLSQGFHILGNMTLPPAIHQGILNFPGATPDSRAIAERLLEQDRQRFHCFWGNVGFHNHLSHQCVALRPCESLI